MLTAIVYFWVLPTLRAESPSISQGRFSQVLRIDYFNDIFRTVRYSLFGNIRCLLFATIRYSGFPDTLHCR